MVADSRIDISGLDKAAVLAALYNASRPLGMGFLHYDAKPMTADEARDILKATTYFDYLKGRVMKISLKSDVLDARLYDRDNGEGAGQRVIEQLRKTSQTITPAIQQMHERGKLESAAEAAESMETEQTVEQRGDIAVHAMTLKDQEQHLRPAIDKALHTKP